MPTPNKPSNDLLRYAGLGGQILASLGLAVFIGLKLDKWTGMPFPLLVWLLPFVIISIMMVKLIKETSKKK